MDIPRTLLVTDDYPPRVGGIQRTLHSLMRELPPDRVAVLAPSWPGSEAFDAAEPYEIHRSASYMWPTPDTRRLLQEVVHRTKAEVALFGDALPLGMFGPMLAKQGVPYLVAAHGFDYWLSLVPGAASVLRRATSRASRVVVMCSAFIARVVRTAVPDRVPVSVMYPGADIERFHPDLPTAEVRARHGISEDDPLVVCVSRLVRRKGQDVLIRGLPTIRRRVPDARLLVVGGGPYRGDLERMASEAEPGTIVFSGEVSDDELPNYYAAGDVFAMPCRTRLGGFEVEGWGNVFLEAAACARPVVAGNSGGAPEAVDDGVTGLVVDGAHPGAVAEAVGSLLVDPVRARAMGKAGRARVERSYTWPHATAKLAFWLREAAEGRQARRN
ncbi:MAG: glycosyltransferase family 4 protein [Actinomycetota bacterium]|nr:glycosyltransferase family 4 protein [Actinomycetota bacterium]